MSAGLYPGEDSVSAVEDYRFTPEHLAVGTRLPGISAFMRIRNGEDFLEAAIRSHIDHVDEVVAVYNRCTDRTPEILARLAGEYGPSLRVYHYVPDVYPPGSEGHQREPADAPTSLVNYYNFALTRTRFRFAMKLDDDHVALPVPFAAMTAAIRAGTTPPDEMVCFSGINLARDAAGRLGILASEPLAGAGDHGIFAVRPDTYFVHDPRFERLQLPGIHRRFRGFGYRHLKFLKPGFGFSNYDLAANPRSRYTRKLSALQRDRRIVAPAELAQLMTFSDRALVAARLARLPLPEKQALIADRWIHIRRHPFGDEALAPVAGIAS